jgi:hypothetical protein
MRDSRHKQEHLVRHHVMYIHPTAAWQLCRIQRYRKHLRKQGPCPPTRSCNGIGNCRLCWSI